MKRSVFDKYGKFDESLKVCMDYDFWLKVKDKTNWGFLNRVISAYAIRPGARSTSQKYRKSNLAETAKVLKRYLTPLEYMTSLIINKLVDLYNKVYV